MKKSNKKRFSCYITNSFKNECVCVCQPVSIFCISFDSRALVLFSSLSVHSFHAILSNVKTNYINQFDERKYIGGVCTKKTTDSDRCECAHIHECTWKRV